MTPAEQWAAVSRLQTSGRAVVGGPPLQLAGVESRSVDADEVVVIQRPQARAALPHATEAEPEAGEHFENAPATTQWS